MNEVGIDLSHQEPRRLTGHALVANRLVAGNGVEAVYLLTTTAADYFRRMGFMEQSQASA